MPTKSIASILIIAIVVVIAVRIVLVVIGIGRTIRVRIGIVIMASIICILWLVYCLIGVLGYVWVGVVIHIVIVLAEYVLPLAMRVVLMMVVVVMDLYIEVASSVFRFRLVATISHDVFSKIIIVIWLFLVLFQINKSVIIQYCTFLHYLWGIL